MARPSLSGLFLPPIFAFHPSAQFSDVFHELQDSSVHCYFPRPKSSLAHKPVFAELMNEDSLASWKIQHIRKHDSFSIVANQGCSEYFLKIKMYKMPTNKSVLHKIQKRILGKRKKLKLPLVCFYKKKKAF